MQRTINVSTDVFAEIWASRQEGENNEDEILRRVLGCAGAAPAPGGAQQPGGVYDSRNGVRFAEGFQVFRRYKGAEYTAVASGGSWVRQDDSRRFPTLNQLNASIAAGAENVWNGNWKFEAADGSIRSIAYLRRKQ